MANFPKMTLTNAGIALQTKVQAGATLAFKRLALGDGALNGSPVSPLTALIGEKASVTVTSGKIMGADTYQIGGLFVNTSIVAGFWWREIGVYATDPTDSEKEILYCYANAGDAGDYIPPSTDQRIEKHIYASMAVANASSVAITIPSSDSYVLTSEKGAADGVATLGTDGKIPSAQMPTMNYEAPLSGAAAKATIADADKVVITDSATSNSTKSVLWSYIKGLFAQKVHTHTASDLTTLVPVPGGGTGAADAAGARANLGAVGESDLAEARAGVGALYVWEKLSGLTHVGYVASADQDAYSPTITLGDQATSSFSGSLTVEYAAQIVYKNNAVTLVDPVVSTLGASYASLAGKYAVWGGNPVYKVTSASFDGTLVTITRNPVTATWPDGFKYNSLGQIGASLCGARVVMGSYTGTGTKERSLTFPSPPRLLFVAFKTAYGSYSGGMFLVCNAGGFSFGTGGAPINTTSEHGGYAVVSKVEGSTVTWKNDSSASYMQNQSGSTYDYAAIL